MHIMIVISIYGNISGVFKQDKIQINWFVASHSIQVWFSRIWSADKTARDFHRNGNRRRKVIIYLVNWFNKFSSNFPINSDYNKLYSKLQCVFRPSKHRRLRSENSGEKVNEINSRLNTMADRMTCGISSACQTISLLATETAQLLIDYWQHNNSRLCMLTVSEWDTAIRYNILHSNANLTGFGPSGWA